MDFHNNDLGQVPLDGEMASTSQTNQAAQSTHQGYPSTLDEPVRDTILRDLKAVGVKLYHVFIPRSSNKLLREWDLWGPLVLCTLLAMILQSHKSVAGNDGGPQFAEVFFLYWIGATAVTLNAKLLGGAISFFQSLCILGYCVFPLLLSLIVCRIVLLMSNSMILFIARLVVVAIGFAWSVFASTAFMASSQPPNRKALALYPVFLFYFILSWMVLSHNG